MGGYSCFLFVLPNIINSPENIAKYEAFLKEKTGINFRLENFHFQSNPNFTVDVNANEIILSGDNAENIANLSNIRYHTFIFNLKGAKLKSDYIYVDLKALKNSLKPKKENEETKFNLKYLPKLSVAKAYIKFNDKTYADIRYIDSYKHFGKYYTKIFARLVNPYTKSPLIIGKTGSISFSDKIEFNDFSAQLDNSKIYLTGGRHSGLKITANDLPVHELEKSFLYFYKLKHPNKRNFIENFDDFGGLMDIDLIFHKRKLSGRCVTKNLKANFTGFKIPVVLPRTVFEFKDNNINAKTTGTFAQEPVTTDFNLSGLFSKNLELSGSVKSQFHNHSIKKYIPQVEVVGNADALVKYHNKNGKIDVYYDLTLDKGSDLKSDFGNLNNTNLVRKLSMHTQKQGEPMEIKDYSYSVSNGGEYQKILFGDGLFDKIDGHYKLANLNVVSNGRISVNYISSFLKDFIHNGTFDTDLKLDFINKNILGKMNLYDVSHEDFLYLKNAALTVEKDTVSLKSNGTFYGSVITLSAKTSNKFRDSILVHDIDIFLDKFFVQRGKLTSIPKTFSKGKKPAVHRKKKKINITVEQGRVRVARIYGNKFDVRNVNIQGSLKNDIADFVIPQAQYANGILTAKGIYNLANHSSDIHFFASDIDSNKVATEILKLPNHVMGDAYATLHLITKNKLNDVKAKATFAISDGYLPKIGTQEFVLGAAKAKKKQKPTLLSRLNIKINLSKIINLDFSKPEDFATNLYGSFYMDNDYVKDVKIYSKNYWVGLFIEGVYNIETQYGNINIWGKRNKTHAKGIKIFKIPINLIYKIVFRPEHSKEYYDDKIKMIPDVKTGIGDETELFRAFVCGEFNNRKNLKITLKNIK